MAANLDHIEQSIGRAVAKMQRNSRETVPHIDSNIGVLLMRLLYEHGFPQHRIAALFDCNSGRVAERVGERDDD